MHILTLDDGWSYYALETKQMGTTNELLELGKT